ncbi:hypothetical protein VF12_37570, partial [Nostoc linckia z15]
MKCGDRWLIYAVVDKGQVLETDGLTALEYRKSAKSPSVSMVVPSRSTMAASKRVRSKSMEFKEEGLMALRRL